MLLSAARPAGREAADVFLAKPVAVPTLPEPNAPHGHAQGALPGP
ncbi:hypothetical protein MXAN_2982 [Myxococcus xanthus DK 1622]|uniref:Uncharacterized protein n=1 Tax=Myxococcus xanthus (strain DK1622) TaxID=246197 RepID=Q1D832_MYXXD|nr:hypothetical protein [Myxococcus sp. CA005]ABF89379.1 hypothetical protein MXAN_2982 [Myxococcus xanthus DK 1622]